MPRGDGTGPMGVGKMTGRGMGFCAGNDIPGYMNPRYVCGGFRRESRGLGRGMGYGRHWGISEPIAEPEEAVLFGRRLSSLEAKVEEIASMITGPSIVSQ